jgi:hypothetical protein
MKRRRPAIFSALGISPDTVRHMSDPDKVRLVVEPVSEPDSGPTLAELRMQLGGTDEGMMTDPWFGNSYPVDLSRWRDLPPETRFLVRFTYDTSTRVVMRPIDAIQPLLLAALPDDEEGACTFDDLLRRRLTLESVPEQPNGPSERSEITLEDAMSRNRRWSKASVRATLTRMVRSGTVLRVGRGSMRDPFRYSRKQLFQ